MDHRPTFNPQNPTSNFAALNYGVYRPQFLTNHCQMKNAFTIAGMVLLATESFAQLTLDEAEKNFCRDWTHDVCGRGSEDMTTLSGIA